ncbi:hypothetical protein B0H14DRAFT_3652080 [Mycena olivaceomarginata]|nr:hypothetical protein B0H14DRAFT_3652080 [Mycena olivaceomarginata]
MPTRHPGITPSYHPPRAYIIPLPHAIRRVSRPWMSNSYFSNHSAHSRFLAISPPPPPRRPPRPARRPAPGSQFDSDDGFQRADSGEGTGRARALDVEALFHKCGGARMGRGGRRGGAAAERASVAEYLGVLVPPATHAGEQDRELRGRHQARRGVQQRRVPLGPHNPPRAPLRPRTHHRLPSSSTPPCSAPVWEDPLNITGGKWDYKVAQGGVADRCGRALCVCCGWGGVCGVWARRPPTKVARESWEDDDSHAEAVGRAQATRPRSADHDQRAQSEDIISLWNRVRRLCRDTLRTVLGLPAATVMEYKSNNASVALFRASATKYVGRPFQAAHAGAWREAGVVVVVVGQRNAVRRRPDVGDASSREAAFRARGPFGEESGMSGERGCPCRWLRAGEGKNEVERAAGALVGSTSEEEDGPSEMDVVPRGPPERMQQRLRTPDDLMPRQLAAEGEEEEEAGEDGEREGGGRREAGREERERQRGHELFYEREESRNVYRGARAGKGAGSVAEKGSYLAPCACCLRIRKVATTHSS